MKRYGMALALWNVILISLFYAGHVQAAAPIIDVALKTSFDAGPYLVELLETAADHNASCYFPLLDRIADGVFAGAETDEALYSRFVQVLQDDGYMSKSALSTYQLALSMRAAAPRIEAHYQYYHTAVEPSLVEEQSSSCSVWIHFQGKQYCSTFLDKAHGTVKGVDGSKIMQFDRVLGRSDVPAAILYADITSPMFGHFHRILALTARMGTSSYRIRHRRTPDTRGSPLFIPGYGVELSLKRTDYIVIDDREAEKAPPHAKDLALDDEDLADLQPLSSAELASLGLKAAEYVMQSPNQMETLLRLAQDFPKYSHKIVAQNVSEGFLAEHEYNREQLVPSGYNVWWVNGVQISDRNVQALAILDIIQKERQLMSKFKDLGVTAQHAIKLLSHEAVAMANAENESPRYDWRDDAEDGNVIIWMNNIDKDRRYAEMPSNVKALLQRTYPGQIPQLRKEAFNLVVPVDLTSQEDTRLVAETLAGFVKRRLTIRIGLVPLATTAAASEHAKIAYYLHDSYGLSAVIAYLEVLSEKKPSQSQQSMLDAVVENRTIRDGKTLMSAEEVITGAEQDVYLGASRLWTARLDAATETPTIFINGVAITRDEAWLQAMSQRIQLDLQSLQNAIFRDIYDDDSYLPDHFLQQAISRRNSLITPENEKAIKLFPLGDLAQTCEAAFNIMPRVQASSDADLQDSAWLMLIADLSTEAGRNLLQTVRTVREANPAIDFTLVHNGAATAQTNALYETMQKRGNAAFNSLADFDLALSEAEVAGRNIAEAEAAADHYWHSSQSLLQDLGIATGQSAVLLNGRLVGPIPKATHFVLEDFDQLLAYERLKRIVPARKAMEALGIDGQFLDSLTLAKLLSLISTSATPAVSESVVEQQSAIRIGDDIFDSWNSSYTAMEIGDKATASVQMVISLNPASTNGQKWTPLIKVLSELEGVHTRIFLNPVERLTELPVKSFYRYVLETSPSFDESGKLRRPAASFQGLPKEALLTLALDVPPAWLVMAKEANYDLDNIKLSSAKADIRAVYELEHILIEGHSRETDAGIAPRGAQLLLATENDAKFADTIIMANLGYFQFRANPGYYKINLKEGRSAAVYNIDSLGAQGWSPKAGEHNNDLTLMSFAGTTLFPRLTRKFGMESEDVLEEGDDSPRDYVSRGLSFAQSILGRSKAVAPANAEINIFSIASGHLYDRMLNIMMRSVMKHTKRTVKFWFIEQFMSPSFKEFVPYLAAEYGFQYEMVAFKWPHWLRGQTEKQREIWGYKVLFLDVLFPLSLDKVIFVDADQIVRTDLMELVNFDLEDAPYGFTPMCDSRVEMEGYRFWKQGYWKSFLRGLPYHISALFVVDLKRFRQIAAGDRLRQQYHQLSADPGSLSNLDQDLPNHMQSVLPIKSLPQEWLWCETWCSDESLAAAKTIDLCQNPMTFEPKLDRARRQVPEWTVYDDEITALDRRRRGESRVAHEGEEKEEREEKREASPSPSPAFQTRETDEQKDGSVDGGHDPPANPKSRRHEDL